MKEELIIKVLSRSSEFLTEEQVRHLRLVLDQEFYNYDVQPVTTALVPFEGTPDKIALFLATKKLKGLSKNTLKEYQRTLIKFFQVIRKDVDQVNAMDIRMYLAVYSQSGVKNSTVSTLISTLKSFFEWLQVEDYIEKNPMLKIDSIKIEKRVRKALTTDELEMLRIACKTYRDRALTEIFYSTGCRLDEVCKLNKTDIDWNTGTIMVIGKGNKERPVYLNAKAKIYLKRYLHSRTDDNPALFVSEKQPHNRLSRRSIEVTFNELGKKAGIQKKVFPHLIRHTTATHLLQNGATLADVQQILGHDDPATTQIYAEMDKSNVQQVHKKCLA